MGGMRGWNACVPEQTQCFRRGSRHQPSTARERGDHTQDWLSALGRRTILGQKTWMLSRPGRAQVWRGLTGTPGVSFPISGAQESSSRDLISFWVDCHLLIWPWRALPASAGGTGEWNDGVWVRSVHSHTTKQGAWHVQVFLDIGCTRKYRGPVAAAGPWQPSLKSASVGSLIRHQEVVPSVFGEGPFVSPSKVSSTALGSSVKS